MFILKLKQRFTPHPSGAGVASPNVTVEGIVFWDEFHPPNYVSCTQTFWKLIVYYVVSSS